jgi:hypothetical protein
MIAVSTNLKTAVRQPAKQVKAYINDSGTLITESDDLQSLKITSSGEMLKSIMRTAEATFFGNHNLLDKYVNLGLGIILADLTTEYVDYGKFKITKYETNEGNDSIKVTMYDKMYEALQKYDLEPIYDLVFPCTLLELLQAICDRFSWTLASSSFPNYSLEISDDIFSGLGLSFRNVIDQIAEASGSIIYFDINDELTVRQLSNVSQETVDKNDLFSLKLESKFGGINSVVLSRQPQEDNIAELDYNYRMQLVIDHSKISGSSDLVDFPAHISIVNANLKSVANGGHVNNGTYLDFQFRGDDGTILAHEIASYDATTGTLLAWVKIPLLSPTTDTQIYIYYGKATLSASPGEQNWHVEDSI